LTCKELLFLLYKSALNDRMLSSKLELALQVLL